VRQVPLSNIGKEAGLREGLETRALPPCDVISWDFGGCARRRQRSVDRYATEQ